jgi:membrane-anchored protein YejM (alkaline phosphatase superfamily)
MKQIYLYSGICAALICNSIACNKDKSIPKTFKAKNVVVVIIDGPRYSETFGDSTQQYIPELMQIAKQGVLFTNMRNQGVTNTINGIAAITTGNYNSLSNNGAQMPLQESFLNRFLVLQQNTKNKVWIISSKDKIEALKSCAGCNHAEAQMPSTNCGIAGLNTGYRDDSTTNAIALQTMQQEHPQVILIHFKEPDASGHAADWNAYTNGIRSTSKYTKAIFDFLQQDSFYHNTTALFVTNDHGRHLNNVADGFVSHGDNCDGCRHISLIAAGPDFGKDVIDATPYSQIDITSTINEMFRLNMKDCKGKPIGVLVK